ncbi:hypothetical protein ACFFF7_13305 [Novosphingobium aquiterrae]|uniref:Lipoprotein n=1 Tax=Novosphingobium aquiterrae TaxID=624388 RepID=A0ABV6PKN5_9SPHN
MRTRITLLALVAAPLALAGCATDGAGMKMADNWGEANRQTMAAQIIDPDPQYDTANPLTSGDHAAKAVDRYNKDQVKKPDKVRTTNIGTGGGGGGGGGSSGGN